MPRLQSIKQVFRKTACYTETGSGSQLDTISDSSTENLTAPSNSFSEGEDPQTRRPLRKTQRREPSNNRRSWAPSQSRTGPLSKMLRRGEREFGDDDSDSIDQPPHYSELWLPMQQEEELQVEDSPRGSEICVAAPTPQCRIKQCVVCLQQPVSYIFIPCGHPAVCGPCAMSWGIPLPSGEARCCPVCRGNVGAVMRFHGTVVEDVDVTNVQEDVDVTNAQEDMKGVDFVPDFGSDCTVDFVPNFSVDLPSEPDKYTVSSL
mmetsp:Transcript_27895/g.40791  ORF Transcript_27895/g.40791 Transcript_27895/m.40791 type:complete len:261 (+) Transcript_27895:361-1143(+)